MARRFGWHSLLLLLMAGCTGETVTAPGACPAYCVGITVEATDTVLSTAIAADSMFMGYVPSHTATRLMVSGAGAGESRAILRFYPFSDTILLNLGDTARRAVLQTDSFRVEIELGRRTAGVSGLRLALYRLPPTVDSLTTFETLDPFFDDSTFITDVAVPPADSSDSVKVTFPATALPTFSADSQKVAIGVALRASAPAFVALRSSEAGAGAFLSRFVKVDSVTGTPVSRVAASPPLLDTYVFQPVAPPGPGILTVGGAPSARTFFHLDVPRRIVDSSNVVRATLFLIPAAPVVAPPGDTLRIVAHPLAADIGAKSPVLPATADTARGSGGLAPPGMSDTVKVDLTDIIRAWRTDTTQAHTVVLRASPEGGSFGVLQFWSTADPTRRPTLDITYVPPISYQGR
ncbi:MAG: hypothetical protein HY700_17105 [Gemmatimonadetes bacterium]|nr:hypothetical protein [Gemmatimonadota bacterium]